MTTLTQELPSGLLIPEHWEEPKPLGLDYGTEPRMHIVAISDLHGYLPPIPDCDLLIIAGDVSPWRGSHDPDAQAKWWDGAFGPWLAKIEAGRKVLIAGNHDFVAQRRPEFIESWVARFNGEAYGKIIYLEDEAVEINGFKIYGYPWVPLLRNWAFFASDAALVTKAQMIPTDTDILITHGPPHGIGDKTKWGDLAGEPELRVAITHRLKQLKLHVFGHIHEAYGEFKIPFKDELYICNASYMPVDYGTKLPANRIMQFETVGRHIIPIDPEV